MIVVYMVFVASLRRRVKPVFGVKPPKEQEADAFASELLIPIEQLKRFQGNLKSPDKLAGIFLVSRPAMVIAVANFFGSARDF